LRARHFRKIEGKVEFSRRKSSGKSKERFRISKGEAPFLLKAPLLLPRGEVKPFGRQANANQSKDLVLSKIK